MAIIFLFSVSSPGSIHSLRVLVLPGAKGLSSYRRRATALANTNIRIGRGVVARLIFLKKRHGGASSMHAKTTCQLLTHNTG